jgi:hypothetical protein
MKKGTFIATTLLLLGVMSYLTSGRTQQEGGTDRVQNFITIPFGLGPGEASGFHFTLSAVDYTTNSSFGADPCEVEVKYFDSEGKEPEPKCVMTTTRGMIATCDFNPPERSSTEGRNAYAAIVTVPDPKCAASRIVFTFEVYNVSTGQTITANAAPPSFVNKSFGVAH